MKYILGYKYDHCSITLYLESKKGKCPASTTFHRLNWDENTINNIEDFVNKKINDLINNARLSDYFFKIDYNELKQQSKNISSEFSEYLRTKNKLLNVSIKDWYKENYPQDEVGEHLSNFSFKDLNNLLNSGVGDVYTIIGYTDSIVRERCFERLADITEQDYDVVYNKWINLDDREEELEIER